MAMTDDDRDDELETMSEVRRLLGKVDKDAASRIVRWLADRYGVVALGRAAAVRRSSPEDAGINGDQGPDLAATYEAAQPSTRSERVMVITYWFQAVQGQTDVDSQQVNTELKQLGHGLKNITMAFSELIRVRPQLVIQVRKAGSTRQARKRYRLTAEGIKKVKALLSGGTTDE